MCVCVCGFCLLLWFFFVYVCVCVCVCVFSPFMEEMPLNLRKIEDLLFTSVGTFNKCLSLINALYFIKPIGNSMNEGFC